MVRGAAFYFNAGVFYRSSTAGYLVVHAPLGARVSVLPSGYISFSVGLRRYFHINNTYYLQDKESYLVVEKPQGAENKVIAVAKATAGGMPEAPLVVYPNSGQSNEQRRQDKFECYQWAVVESEFDPLLNQAAKGKDHYQKAYTSCLQGRGYTVN